MTEEEEFIVAAAAATDEEEEPLETLAPAEATASSAGLRAASLRGCTTDCAAGALSWTLESLKKGLIFWLFLPLGRISRYSFLLCLLFVGREFGCCECSAASSDASGAVLEW
jgi:hypothetical protein